MKVKLGEHEYEVRIPAKAWPHLQILAQAASGIEVDELKSDEAEKKVLAFCVSPPVCDEHRDIILLYIMSHYASLMREAATLFQP